VDDYFPDTAQHPFMVNLRGVGNGLATSRSYVCLEIPGTTTTGTIITYSGEFHIVDKLDCGILAGSDTLLPNGAVIDLAKEVLYLHGTYYSLPTQAQEAFPPKIRHICATCSYHRSWQWGAYSHQLSHFKAESSHNLSDYPSSLS
jgi:hypothetical protein